MKHKNERLGNKGSVIEFDDNWKIRTHETRQNYFTRGVPKNQIMMSFYNQWQVYKRFIGVIKPGMKVLEPGCGRGSISCYFSHAGFDTYLLDTSQEALDVAKDIFKENNLSARYECEDALNMPYPDDYFDVIVHCGLLEHFEDYEAAVREQYRVLKPGGVILNNIVPGKWSVQVLFRPVNTLLKYFHSILAIVGLADDIKKRPKKPVYRSDHGAKVYADLFRSMGAAIEYDRGIFPVPSLSYSPEFPFTVMHPLLERPLVALWYVVLVVRKVFCPWRHPWMCSEWWGQHVLVVARKPKKK